jgi:hypothetical protein
LCVQDRIYARWRFNCVLALPWRPILAGYSLTLLQMFPNDMHCEGMYEVMKLFCRFYTFKLTSSVSVETKKEMSSVRLVGTLYFGWPTNTCKVSVVIGSHRKYRVLLWHSLWQDLQVSPWPYCHDATLLANTKLMSDWLHSIV